MGCITCLCFYLLFYLKCQTYFDFEHLSFTECVSKISGARSCNSHVLTVIQSLEGVIICLPYSLFINACWVKPPMDV
jgi:hypothetical protein